MIQVQSQEMHVQIGDLLPVLPDKDPVLPIAYLLALAPLPKVPAGSFLKTGRGQAGFQALSTFRHPLSGQRCLWLQAKQKVNLTSGSQNWQIDKQGFSLAWITLSDKGHQGLRQDASGPLIPELVQNELQLDLVKGFLLPDDEVQLRGLLTELCLEQAFDLVFTTGGTGVTSRDITPEATLRILDRRLPGFEQAMLQASLAQTPQAVISRAAAGILDRSLIVNLPGSPKAVQENLQSILPALRHTLEKIHDQPSECAR
ncbi:MAG: MogA/MoaB family molybdenum cofactor biosynthesis protein [Desulfohalobiaceae bacterium]